MALNTRILKESFEAIKPVADKAVDRFYGDLFKNHPDAKSLFEQGQSEKRKTAAIQVMTSIFECLEDPKGLASYLGHLGARYAKRGAKPEHYDWGVDSLLNTLKFFFDDTWTDELEDAWMAALGLIVETMKSAASIEVLSNKTVEVSFKEEIEIVFKDLMREALLELVKSRDMRDFAMIQAKGLIKDSLRTQLDELKAKFKAKKPAA